MSFVLGNSFIFLGLLLRFVSGCRLVFSADNFPLLRPFWVLIFYEMKFFSLAFGKRSSVLALLILPGDFFLALGNFLTCTCWSVFYWMSQEEPFADIHNFLYVPPSSLLLCLVTLTVLVSLKSWFFLLKLRSLSYSAFVMAWKLLQSSPYMFSVS